MQYLLNIFWQKNKCKIGALFLSKKIESEKNLNCKTNRFLTLLKTQNVNFGKREKSVSMKKSISFVLVLNKLGLTLLA